MFRFAFCGFLISIFVFSSCKTTATKKNVWQEEAITVDGILDDWKTPFLQAGNYTSILYNVSNDATHLYVGIRIPDQITQLKAMQLGMRIWIDTSGKKRQHIGVGYPLALSTDQMSAIAQKGNPADPTEAQQAYIATCQEFDLLGIVDEAIRASNLTSKEFKVGAGFDDFRALTFEVKIPLKQIYKAPLQFDEVLGIAIKVNAPKATIDDESTLFNDPTQNPITASNPLMGGTGNQLNPNGQLNNPNNPMNPNGQAMPQPSRSPGNYSPNIWIKTQLAGE